jgi:glutaminase
MDLPSISEQADHPYVSTGHLPEPEVQRLVRTSVSSRTVTGTTHKSIPRWPGFRERFGICVVGTGGQRVLR